MSEPPATDLCLSCGLCCDGSLFRTASAAPEESARLAAAGMDVFESEKGPRFRQPCPQLASGACAIYAERPGVCRTYRCRLLRRVESGEVGIREALATVGKARETIRRLTERRAELATLEARMRLRKAGPAGDGGAESGRLYVDSVALDLFLSRHFRGKDEEQTGSA